MSVYEELLKRKLISEENGQVNINKDHINQEKQNMQNNGLYLQEPKITSLWDRILSNAQKTQKNKTFFDDIGGTAENTWLGVKHGVEDASDYVDAIMDRFRTKPTGSQISMSRVIGSNKLSDNEKARYLMTKINPELAVAVDDNMVNNISTLAQNFNLPIDKEKLNQKRQEILQKYNQSPTRQKMVEILKQDKEKIDQIANTPSEIENAFLELGKQKEKLRNEEDTKISQNIAKSTNDFTGKLAELAPSVGNMATGAVLTAVNPALGSTYFMTSAGGSYLKDAKERGMDEDQALIYATVMGGVEGLSEQLTWGNLSKAGKAIKTFVGSAGKEAVKEGAKQVATNSLKEGLKSYGIGIAENTIQEAIIEPIQELTAGVVADKANWENMPERMLNAGVNGGLIALITGGADVGVNSCVAVQEKLKNGIDVTQEEIQASAKDATTALGEEKSQETFKNGSKTAIEMAKNELNTQNETTTENKQFNVPTKQTNLPINENASNQNVVPQNQSSIQGKSFEDIVDEAMSNYESNEVPSPLKNRDINTIGKETKVNAYQYDNPEVKPYFQEMAQMIGEDLGNIASEDNRKTVKGGGTALNTNTSAIEKLHNEMGYSYNQIIDGIVDIIDDHGQENNALSKKLEIIIDDQLRNGYRNSYGKFINPNEEYINLINNSNQNMAKNTTDIRDKQLEIINQSNPMQDDYHTGIRSIDDIKTFDEVIDDDESFVYGDFSKEDAEKALKNGKVMVYSSKPIEQGSFVSTSQNMAKDYAGNGKIYSQEVDLNDVAWINGDEGQYAKVDNLANNSKKVYNIINKSLTKNERAQVASEVRRWRINQEDGIGYIDLSDQGYKSYIYNKNGSNVETLLKVNGSEEFRNFIRKGIEDGTYKKSTDINGWASNAKLQYKNNSNVNDVLPNRGNSQTTSRLYDTTSGQQTGNNRTETIEQSSGNESVKNSNQSSFNLPQKEKINLPTKGEEINWNEIERPEGKIRKHYKSIIESSNTTAEAKAIAKEMMGLDTYVPESNKSLIKKADARINNTNPDTELNSLYSRVMNNEKVNAIDIAVGERLIEYYSKIGDKEHLSDAIHATAMAGTQAGRTVQAMALLNHMTPQGQVTWLQRSIDKANTELQDRFKKKKNVPQFELTQDMIDKVLNTETKEEMFTVLDDVYEELGQQVPKSTSEKIDEWRYFSMLANLKTHGRNMIGNLAMHGVQRVKDKVAGAIEGTVAQFNPNMERTHTIMPASKEVKQFAKNDLKNIDVQTQLGMNENKYNPQSRLQNARRTFKSDILEKTLGKMFDINSTALEVEDNIGLKSMYVKALSEYITANKLDINNMTDAQLQKARQHAVKSAQEATFHQASSLATWLNQVGKQNNLKKFFADAAVPFKKTPINVAKTGAQYSPIGLVKSAVFDIGKLRRGDITVNQYIDNISKGLTGTGITFLGYALAEAGILKASGGEDDKKEKYDEEQGKQTYSLEIGGKSYSLDWLSPVGIPLFIGAETNQQLNQTKKEKNSKSNDDDTVISRILQSVANIANGTANAMNPMSEMSMVSGLTNILSSYNKENAVGDMIVNTGKSYVNQFIPTALGQLARTTDDYERTTKSTKSGTLEKAVDSTINQIKSKIPGLRQTLPTKTDIWGQDVKQSENLPFRAFNNFVNPSIIKDISTDKVDTELNKLYGETKNNSIIPASIDKTMTINKQDYRMTNEEYAKYSKNYGEKAHTLLENLFESDDYKNMTTEQKEKAIENAYKYAKEDNKVDYAKNNGLELEESTLYQTMSELKPKEQSEYLSYYAKASELDKEVDKNKLLADSNYSKNVKSIIYENTTGKDDNLYGTIKDSIDINQYLNYKTNEFKSDRDENGKEIKGSAKKDKLYEYVNTHISGYENRLAILGQNYKLSRSEQEALLQYLMTTSNKKENIEKYSKNFEVKDGQVYYK